MKRLYLPLLLTLAPAVASAAELALLYGAQGGGQLEHIDSGVTLDIDEEPVYALIAGTPLDRERDLELFYSRQRTSLRGGGQAVADEALINLEIHYLHLGGTVHLGRVSHWQGFLSGGLGLTHLSPVPSGAASETRASMSLGLGARWMPAPRVGLRLESRLLGTLFNSNTTLFCSGGCVFSVSGNLLTQYAVMAGVVIRFD